MYIIIILYVLLEYKIIPVNDRQSAKTSPSFAIGSYSEMTRVGLQTTVYNRVQSFMLSDHTFYILYSTASHPIYSVL